LSIPASFPARFPAPPGLLSLSDLCWINKVVDVDVVVVVVSVVGGQVCKIKIFIKKLKWMMLCSYLLRSPPTLGSILDLFTSSDNLHR